MSRQTIAEIKAMSPYDRGFYWGRKRGYWPDWLAEKDDDYCRGYRDGMAAASAS